MNATERNAHRAARAERSRHNAFIYTGTSLASFICKDAFGNDVQVRDIPLDRVNTRKLKRCPLWTVHTTR